MHASSSSAPSEEPQITAPPLDPNTAPATNYHKMIPHPKMFGTTSLQKLMPELEVEPCQISPYIELVFTNQFS
jgi:hypothetical protein